MPLVRLLAFSLLFCPAWSFAQAAPESPQPVTPQSTLLAITPESSYVWRITPNQSSNNKILVNQDQSSKQHLLLPDRDGNLLVVKPPVDRGIRTAGDSPVLGDAFCLSIRSYVVARNSKDSDATHLVRSTTCVPASKYKIKVVQQPNSVIHP